MMLFFALENSLWPGHLPLNRMTILKDVSEQKTPRIYSSLEEVSLDSSCPVVLLFFSVSCYACWDELFDMKNFIEKMGLPARLIGVSADTVEELQDFVLKYSFPCPIVRDDDRRLYRRYKVRLEPYRVILYKKDIIYSDDYLLDYQTRREKAKQCLLKILSQPTPF